VNDWESRWALGLTLGPRQGQGGWDGRFDKEYIRTLTEHYRPFWKLGISVDVIESLSSFARYRLVVAPMLFMLKPGVAERLLTWVKGGGTLVLTYLSGIVNETSIVFRGVAGEASAPRDLGEEIDLPLPDRRSGSSPRPATPWGHWHPVRATREVHPEATSATFKNDFTRMPALTVNRHGPGRLHPRRARRGTRSTTACARPACAS
jgi:beta-galactosidase